MRTAVCGLFVAGALAGQSLQGPVMGYVVDGSARMRPLYGMPAAGHVGAAVREGVRDSWGSLALLADGTALRDGVELEGRWATLQPGAFLDATGREALIAGESRGPWRLTLPEPALAVRVSASGERVLALLADESLTAWSSSGKAEWRMAASKWWSVAFAGERGMAYDPSAHALFWLDGAGGTTMLRKLDGEGGAYQMAVDRAGKNAVLLGGKALLVPVSGGDVRVVDVPEGSERLESLQGGRAFLLTRDPARPIWILDPDRKSPLLVVPALEVEKGGQR